MQLPEELQSAIDAICRNTPPSELRKAREALTQNYREGQTSPFHTDSARLAYLAARMPATFAACTKVFEQIHLPFNHLLDLGAGPGTASWAAATLFPSLSKVTLVEKSPEAIAVGRELAESHPLLKKGTWLQQSLDKGQFPEADVAVLSYVINELKDPISFISSLWKQTPLLIVVEPGTPKNFAKLRTIRQQLIEQGAFILAPCPHRLACPNDWCHFSARIERTRLHRLLKEGSLNYEDEKFSYLIVSQNPVQLFENRILRHPIKQSGRIQLSLCASSGVLKEETVTRKNKELYRLARDAEWGDPWPGQM